MTSQSVRTLLTILAVATSVIFTPLDSLTAEAAASDSEARTVLITGANRGLGFEFARQYSAAGWRVIDGLTIEDTGTFQSWDGKNRAW